jgi:putative ABC transport system ATP-binding protein
MIEMVNISKSYNIGKPNELRVLDQISLQISDGEMVAIMGASGAGKSTLLNILGCVETFDSGVYRLDNLDLAKIKRGQTAQIRNEKIGYVLQDFALIEEDRAIDNVIVPMLFDRTPYMAMKKKALEAMREIGIEDLSHQLVRNMSGGQKQRVALARAIVKNPHLLLADEPTGALDSKTTDEVLRLLKTINEAGRTVVIVTHDSRVASCCRRVISIADGKIREM